MFEVFSLTNPAFYLFGLYFLLVVLLLFIAPVIPLITKLKLSKAWQQITVAFVLGTSLWTLQAFIFGYLQLRFLSYLYVLVALVLVFFHRRLIINTFKNLFREIKNAPKYLLIILIAGILIQLVCISTSGLRNRQTQSLDYYFSNQADGIMHLSFIGSMVEEFPPLRPEIYPEPLTSYHYLSDLFQADLARVFYLPINHLFFHYLPPLISLFTALSLAFIIRFFTKKPSAIIFAWILLFFIADSGYLISFFLHHQVKWNFAAIDNGPEQFLNFPQTMAKLNFYTALSLLLRFWSFWTAKKSSSKKQFWFYLSIIAPIAIVIVGYKVYYGLFFLIGLGLVTAIQGLIAFWQSFISSSIPKTTSKTKSKPKSSFKQKLNNFWQVYSGPCLLGLAVALPALLIFLSNNSQTGGLDWYPLAWPTLLLSPSHLDDIKYTLSVDAYYDLGYLRGILTNAVWAISTCLVTTLGIRLLGFWPLKRRQYPQQTWHWLVFYLPVAFLYLILGLNTLQPQGGFNTFNFFIVSANVLIIPLALNFTTWWSKNKLLKTLVVLLILLALPRSLRNTFDHSQAFIEGRADFSLSASEADLLSQAKEQLPPTALIQPHPENNDSWRRNAYLDLFTHRPVYLSSLDIITSHGQPYQDREDQLFFIFDQISAGTPALQILEQFHQLGITHLYLQNKTAQLKLLETLPPEFITLSNEAGYFIQTTP